MWGRRVADQEKIGTNWGDDELDVIVADYFAMLEAEQAGRSYVKTMHSAAVMAAIGRTHRSVEFKHMNISAVLQEIGLPTISGYKAKANYQRSIFPAIDRYLSANPQVIAPPVVGFDLAVAEPPVIFLEPPPAVRDENPRPAELERLVRKFDPSERDFRNRELGKAGEALILDAERQRLRACDRPDLARHVRWVSQEDGDGAGFDIHSFEHDGSDRLLEVKTTRGGQTTPFYLTRNEKAFSEERAEAFKLVRLYQFGRAPRMFELVPPLEAAVRLSAHTYEARFR